MLTGSIDRGVMGVSPLLTGSMGMAERLAPHGMVVAEEVALLNHFHAAKIGHWVPHQALSRGVMIHGHAVTSDRGGGGRVYI